MQPILKHLPFAAACLLALAGCASSDYSPNTYASNAVQYANKVEPGAIVGFRQVAISANGNIGAYLFGPLTDEIWRLSLGVGYRWNKNFVLKTEYSMERGTTVGGEKRDHDDLVAAQPAFGF